jgi:hypothetical protein
LLTGARTASEKSNPEAYSLTLRNTLTVVSAIVADKIGGDAGDARANAAAVGGVVVVGSTFAAASIAPVPAPPLSLPEPADEYS